MEGAMPIFNATILNENGNTSIRFDDFSNTILFPIHKIPEQFHGHETTIYLTIPTPWYSSEWKFSLRD